MNNINIFTSIITLLGVIYLGVFCFMYSYSERKASDKLLLIFLSVLINLPIIIAWLIIYQHEKNIKIVDIEALWNGFLIGVVIIYFMLSRQIRKEKHTPK